MKLLVDISVPIITFVLLTAVGLDLTIDQFRRLRRRPDIIAAGLIAPVAILPAVALMLIQVFRPSAAVEGGLLLIAACPIGGISNTYSYLAGASTALSVTLTAVSSVLAVATIPFQAYLFELALHRSLGFAAPAILPVQLFLMLVLPVGIGMWIRASWPAQAAANRTAAQRFGFITLALLLAIVILGNLDEFAAGVTETVPLAAGFVLISFFVGWVVGRLIRASSEDRFTLAVEFATRNVAVATAIAVTLLGQAAFAFFASTYFLTELPLMLAAVALFRRRRSHSP
jgi:BASS family bile acid:Na+ symporter